MAHDIWIHLDLLQTAADLKFCWMGWRKQVAFPHNVPKIILHVQTHLCWLSCYQVLYAKHVTCINASLHLSLKLVLVWLLKIVWQSSLILMVQKLGHIWATPEQHPVLAFFLINVFFFSHLYIKKNKDKRDSLLMKWICFSIDSPASL